MKNKKMIVLWIVLSFLIIFIYGIFIKDTVFTNLVFSEQRKEILTYIEEQYDIKPKVTSIIKMTGISDHKYAYYVCMNYQNNNFTAYIYDNGKISDDYMQLKLGRDIYNEVVTSIKSELNLKVLNVKDSNRIYLGYSDNSLLSANITVDELLNQTDRESSLSLVLVLDNNDLSDLELSEKLNDWINGYITERGINHLTVMLDLIEKENVEVVEKEQSDNGYVKRYVDFYGLDVSNFSLDQLKGSIETTTDYENYLPLIND